MFQRLIRYIRSFFSFSNAEAKGFIVMAVAIALTAAWYLLYSNFPTEGYSSLTKDKMLLDSLVEQLETVEARPEYEEFKGRNYKKEAGEKMIVHFQFNPNYTSVDSLQLLGMPEWIARRIHNYRTKGGRFKTKEDLKKIYDFPDSLYQLLKPFIIIPEHTPPDAKTGNNDIRREKEERQATKAIAALDLNNADSLQLRQLKGIGPVLSSRIVRFRNSLGGFVAEEQLYEVYGLDSSHVEALLKIAYVDTQFQPEQIAINSATAEQIADHPYINPAQARLMVEYRKQHGPYTSVNELRNIHTLPQNLIKKIAPYIRFN